MSAIASSAQITRYDGPGHRWLLAARAAAPSVRCAVPNYVGYEEWCTTPVRRLEVPHPSITVIINLGNALTIETPALAMAGTYGSFSAGLHDTAVRTESVGYAAGIELNLTPLGMWQFLGVRMQLLQNRVVSLQDLLGRAARDLEEQLRNTCAWDDRFDRLDAALRAHLQQRVPPREVVWAWSHMVSAPTTFTVSRITDELQWSRRRLAETFKEYVGMTPKAVARIMRFDRATRALRSERPAVLSHVALECGYADQAHLTREFREFAGLTPTVYRQQWSPGGLLVAE